jgi:alkylation response protein AidB-like acyl-CoA dehydrogenase
VHYSLGEDQREVRDLVQRVARERVAPRAHEIDRRAEYPEDMFQLLRELGLFTLPFPAAYGGSGSLLSGCVAVEELGRVCYNTAYLLVVQWTAFGAILAGGTPEQRVRWLPDLASGAKRASISVTEPHSGSDVAGIRTRATEFDGGFRIRGAKAWCTGAPVADFIVVAAKTGLEGRAGIELFIVERDRAGLVIGRKEDKLGGRGMPSCELFFEDVEVPIENRLGTGGTGFKAVMEGFNAARPVIAARGVGLAQGATDLAIDFVSNRHTFGTRVSDNQGIRWMIADMTTKTEAARNLTYRAASMVDSGITGKELAMAAAMSKLFATDVAMQVSIDAVQLFGAAGASNDSPINRYMRDAKLLQIVEGTNQIQRNIIAQALMGRPGAPAPR